MLVFQHVSFESPGRIKDFLVKRGSAITTVKFFESFSLLDVELFDLLIIMGGPMGVYEENRYSWLKDEKKFIEKFIDSGKKVLGVCFGAQLIAEVLGAKIFRMSGREIGWFPVELTAEGISHPFFKEFPGKFEAFHWHGDTFSLPSGALHFARSEGCENQGFIYDNRVVAFQFHLETTPELVEELIKFSGDDLKGGGKYVQEPDEMRHGNFRELNELLFRFLENYFDFFSASEKG